MALPFADASMAKGLRQLSDGKLTASLPCAARGELIEATEGTAAPIDPKDD
jgi:hypothetical protein